MRDGADRTAPQLGKFCGDVRPEEIVSSGNVMFVEFTSDGSGSLPGFAANWHEGK